MTFIPPQTLDLLTDQQIQDLIAIHQNDQQQTRLPGRVFTHNTQEALQIVLPLVNDILGRDKWKLYGGNFFETNIGYRVHADTGWAGESSIWQTIVFPLSYVPTETANYEKNRLIIFNQEWTGRPGFFLKGGDPNPAVAGNTPYDFIFNYDQVKHTIPDFYDPEAVALCRHIDKRNLEGLTVDKSFKWVPGIPITFPRTRLHASTAFHTFGFKQKLGLSLFFSPS